MRRLKKVWRAVRCSANSLSTRDGFGSATATATHYEDPLSYLLRVPRLEIHNQNLRSHPSTVPRTDHDARFPNSEVSKSSPEDSLSMNRTINSNPQGDSRVHPSSTHEFPVYPRCRRH